MQLRAISNHVFMLVVAVESPGSIASSEPAINYLHFKKYCPGQAIPTALAIPCLHCLNFEIGKFEIRI